MSIAVHPKWIVEDGVFKLGKCTFHKELAEDRSKVTGGGWFYWDQNENNLYLYDCSQDFGYASQEEVVRALNSTKFDRRNEYFLSRVNGIYFSDAETIMEARLDSEKLDVVLDEIE